MSTLECVQCNIALNSHYGDVYRLSQQFPNWLTLFLIILKSSNRHKIQKLKRDSLAKQCPYEMIIPGDNIHHLTTMC